MNSIEGAKEDNPFDQEIQPEQPSNPVAELALHPPPPLHLNYEMFFKNPDGHIDPFENPGRSG
jgi:hypothetical protein